MGIDRIATLAGKITLLAAFEHSVVVDRSESFATPFAPDFPSRIVELARASLVLLLLSYAWLVALSRAVIVSIDETPASYSKRVSGVTKVADP